MSVRPRGVRRLARAAARRENDMFTQQMTRETQWRTRYTPSRHLTSSVYACVCSSSAPPAGGSLCCVPRALLSIAQEHAAPRTQPDRVHRRTQDSASARQNTAPQHKHSKARTPTCRAPPTPTPTFLLTYSFFAFENFSFRSQGPLERVSSPSSNDRTRSHESPHSPPHPSRLISLLSLLQAATLLLLLRLESQKSHHQAARCRRCGRACECRGIRWGVAAAAAAAATATTAAADDLIAAAAAAAPVGSGGLGAAFDALSQSVIFAWAARRVSRLRGWQC